jgi:murein L,D-transpeptidase YcbB/YkuD
VLIVYWTVSVGASGALHFAQDVYGLDEAVHRALDSIPFPATRPKHASD